MVTTGGLADEDEDGLAEVTGALVEEEAGFVVVTGALEDEGGMYCFLCQRSVSQSLIS